MAPVAAAIPKVHPRRSRPIASREAQSPLASSPDAGAYATPVQQQHAAALAAYYEADAIEPDVSSARSSFVASVQSSATSTDGEASPRGSRRRFRALRVSIRRPRRRRTSFQYHAPAHLVAQSSFSAVAAARQSNVHAYTAAAPPQSFDESAFYDDQDADQYATMLSSCSSSTTAASHRGPRPSHAESWRTWRHGPAQQAAVPESLSAADECPDKPDASSSSPSLAAPPSTSRRHRAWSKLKAHAPRLSRSGGNGTGGASSKAAAGLFSISFYPWKMEAHGYYSTPEAAVEWVPDTASARCQVCVASFTLARRRHHCRLCGRLVCNDCSLPRTFLPIAEPVNNHLNHIQRRSAKAGASSATSAAPPSLIKSGEAQRTCDSCAATLQRMVAQHDHRVKALCVDNTTVAAASSQPRPSMDTFGRPSVQLARPRGLSKASLVRNDELDQVLRARAKSRAARAGAQLQQHVISSQWLEQWLQYVQMDTGDVGDHGHGHSHSHAPRHSHAGRVSMASSRASMSSHLRRRSSRFALGRRPGPIANYELLDFVNGTLAPRAGLRRSRGADGPGDFHVISHDVWVVFRRLYGGGPCITIDDDAPSCANGKSHLMLHASADDPDATPFDGDFGRPPPPPQWNITELDDVVERDGHAAPTASSLTVEPSESSTTTMTAADELAKSVVGLDRPARVQPRSDQRHLALRSTTACAFNPSKPPSSSRRPASATALAMSAIGPPPMLSRSTSESRSPTVEDPQGRRKSLTFLGSYLKRWRHGDVETPSSSARPSGASTTISQIDDDGVMLYDPAKLTVQRRASVVDNQGGDKYRGSDSDSGSDGTDFSRSRGPEQQRETIAAVSAFAQAAAEARRKSAMSLMRHSTALPMRHSPTTTRAASPARGVMTT